MLLFAAGVAAASFMFGPETQAPAPADYAAAEKAYIAEALNFGDEAKHKISQTFTDTRALPRTASEANVMKPTKASKPEFVREVKLQADYAGETVMIMIYLNGGVVENLLGGEQYVYIAGIRSHDGADTLEWQCGARNVDMALLPEKCRG